MRSMHASSRIGGCWDTGMRTRLRVIWAMWIEAWALEKRDTLYGMEYAATLKKYINVVVHEGASDLHFSTGAHPTVRVAGALTPMLKEDVLKPEDTLGFLH